MLSDGPLAAQARLQPIGELVAEHGRRFQQHRGLLGLAGHGIGLPQQRCRVRLEVVALEVEASHRGKRRTRRRGNRERRLDGVERTIWIVHVVGLKVRLLEVERRDELGIALARAQGYNALLKDAHGFMGKSGATEISQKCRCCIRIRQRIRTKAAQAGRCCIGIAELFFQHASASPNHVGAFVSLGKTDAAIEHVGQRLEVACHSMQAIQGRQRGRIPGPLGQNGFEHFDGLGGQGKLALVDLR